MEGACFSTGLDGEIRYEDEQTKSIDGCIEMTRGWINILKTCTLQGTKKELERLIKCREAYVKGVMKELGEKQEIVK